MRLDFVLPIWPPPHPQASRSQDPLKLSNEGFWADRLASPRMVRWKLLIVAAPTRLRLTYFCTDSKKKKARHPATSLSAKAAVRTDSYSYVHGWAHHVILAAQEGGSGCFGRLKKGKGLAGPVGRWLGLVQPSSLGDSLRAIATAD